MPTLGVVIVSTRPNRVGLSIGRWFAEKAKLHGKFDVQIVDLGLADPIDEAVGRLRAALAVAIEPTGPIARDGEAAAERQLQEPLNKVARLVLPPGGRVAAPSGGSFPGTGDAPFPVYRLAHLPGAVSGHGAGPEGAAAVGGTDRAPVRGGRLDDECAGRDRFRIFNQRKPAQSICERHRHRFSRVLGARDGQPVRYVGYVV